jgi:ABC-type Zn uptake system ZnuABC Zn-binding protein ZnuA
MRTVQVAGALVAVLLGSGCSTPAADQSAAAGTAAPGKLRVATTVAPITSIAANIGGDRVDITGLVPEGTNSHTFEPPPSAAETLSQADVVLVNGLQLEDPTVELAERVAPQAELVELGTTVLPEGDYIYDFSFPKEEGKPNPHLWTDPPYAEKYAEVIRDTFIAQDPENADYYRRNYAAFAEKATELSEAVKAASATLPEQRRRLLTYHDAYAYFAEDYDWQVIGAVQPEDFADPTPREVARIIEQIEAEDVPTIFGSEVFPSPVLAQIGRESGARYEDTLRDDDLPGEPGDPEHSWLGLMRYDFITMVEGLGGDASALREVSVENVAPDKAVYPQ